MLGNFFVICTDFFSKLTFSKNSFMKHFSVKQFGSRSGHSVGPDMGPNYLQRLLAEDKWKEIKVVSLLMDLSPIFNYYYIYIS